MRKFLFCFLCVIFTSINILYADTETLQWYVDGNLYTTTQCESGGDVTLPTTPTKTGYTFDGWLEYIPIEYLGSTGTQAIDTNFVFQSDNIRIIVKFARLDYNGGCLTGAENDQNGWAFVVQTRNYSASNTVFYHYPSVNSACAFTTSVGTAYILEMSQNNGIFSAKLDDNNICKINNFPSSYTKTSFSLFSDKYSTGAYTQKIAARIYYAKIYSDDVLVRDFIPVLDADGVACMYDKVTQQFFYNQGTGNFIAGPQI